MNIIWLLLLIIIIIRCILSFTGFCFHWESNPGPLACLMGKEKKEKKKACERERIHLMSKRRLRKKLWNNNNGAPVPQQTMSEYVCVNISYSEWSDTVGVSYNCYLIEMPNQPIHNHSLPALKHLSLSIALFKLTSVDY